MNTLLCFKVFFLSLFFFSGSPWLKWRWWWSLLLLSSSFMTNLALFIIMYLYLYNRERERARQLCESESFEFFYYSAFIVLLRVLAGLECSRICSLSLSPPFIFYFEKHTRSRKKSKRYSTHRISIFYKHTHTLSLTDIASCLSLFLFLNNVNVD